MKDGKIKHLRQKACEVYDFNRTVLDYVQENEMKNLQYKACGRIQTRCMPKVHCFTSDILRENLR